METRYCPNCGRPLAFLPSRNRYFCNYCRLPIDTEGPAGGPPRSLAPGAGQEAAVGTAAGQDLPAELSGALPAEPPRNATLYAATADLRPVVRRSSLVKGTIETMTEQEAAGAIQAGDYIVLSNVGRCALVAARKAFGEVRLVPRSADQPGMPWRIELSSDESSVEVGLYRAQSAPPPANMPLPRGYSQEQFCIVTLTLKGPPPRLALFVSTLVERLEEAPWSSRFWAALAQSLGLPASKLLIDWKQYLDYAAARLAANDVAAVWRDSEAARLKGLQTREAEAVLQKARAELSRGEWDSARGLAREGRQALDGLQRERQRLDSIRESVTAAVAEIRKHKPDSERAAGCERELEALLIDTSLPPAEAVRRASEVLNHAAFRLFEVYVEKANTFLSALQEEAPELSGRLRSEIQDELESGRRLLEAGNIGGGTEALRLAEEDLHKQAEAYFSDGAESSMEEARQALESLRPAMPRATEAWNEIERELEVAHTLMEQGRAAEAGRLARQLKVQIDDRLASATPEISISITGPPLTAGGWNRVVMKVTNTGTADARELNVTISGPIELMAMDDIHILRAGEVFNDEIGVRSANPGTVPVKLRVECSRSPDGKPFRFESELWLEFRQALDLSGARSITIDRSVHIVDSVLNRSSVSGEDDLEGIPQTAVEDGQDAGGKRVIQDSVINRSGRRQGGDGQQSAQAAPVETKCPTCGRMISVEWKRCPYCS